MNESEQRRLVFHGAIVLLVGCLCGVPVGTSMLQNLLEAEIPAPEVRSRLYRRRRR